MRKTSLAFAALALSALAGSSPAAPSGAFDGHVLTAFKEICLDTGADPAAITTAAEAHRWRKADASGATIAGFAVDAKGSHAREVDDATATVFNWHGAKGPIQAAECQVSVTKGAAGPLRAALATELGFAPQDAEPGKDSGTFQFTGKPGAWTAVDKAGMDAAAGGSGLYRLTVAKSGSGVFLELLKLSK